MKNELKCAFSGHRIIKVDENLKKRLVRELEELINKGVTVFLNGGALGFDLYCAFIVLELRKKYPIKLKMILPCKDQAVKWNYDQRLMYDEVLALSDEVVYISEKYENGCMQRRNKILVDECNYLITYLNRTFGGTYSTVEYAKKTGKEIIYMNL